MCFLSCICQSKTRRLNMRQHFDMQFPFSMPLHYLSVIKYDPLRRIYHMKTTSYFIRNKHEIDMILVTFHN